MIKDAISLLDSLISTPSVSRTESGTADILYDWLTERGIQANRIKNNVWALANRYNPMRPTLMINAHHDTVKPSPAYTFDPFTPQHRDGKIYGLGSNDDGGSVVALASVFHTLYDTELPVNLLVAFSAEEEVSGENGMRTLLPQLRQLGLYPDLAIVGEPTGMQPAIAERGLMVLDCTAHGVTGHAARDEGINALYKAVDDINRLRDIRFQRISPTLGDIKVTVTQIQAGRQHNVVPEECTFVVDVRTTDAYTNEETERIIADQIESTVKARSYRIRASVIDPSHPLVQAAVSLGKEPYVSPTTSDMALMPDIPSLKIGPGQSSRSHSADEYIYEDEVKDAISTYISLITSL